MLGIDKTAAAIDNFEAFRKLAGTFSTSKISCWTIIKLLIHLLPDCILQTSAILLLHSQKQLFLTVISHNLHKICTFFARESGLLHHRRIKKMALIDRSGIWYWRKMINGIMLNRSTKTGDRKAADKIVKQWEHEATQSIVYQKETPVFLHDAINSFLKDRLHMPSHRSATAYMQKWKDALPNGQMKDLAKHQVQAVVTKRLKAGSAQNTVSVLVTYWNALMNFCTGKRWTAGPKLDRVAPKRTRFRVISEQEEAAMLAATSPDVKYPGKNAATDSMRQDNQDILVCLLHLGARINEAQNLRWSDINFEENTILVHRLKGGDDCLLLMTKSLRTVMERRYPLRYDNRVFPTKADNPRSNSNWVNTIVARAGINLEAGKITSHTFRHSCATRLLRSGMDITKVQKFLGHKCISSTLVYLHAIPSEVAAQAMSVFDGD